MNTSTKIFIGIGAVAVVSGIIYAFSKSNTSESESSLADDVKTIKGTDPKRGKFIAIPILGGDAIIKLNADNTFSTHLAKDKSFKYPSPIYKGTHQKFGTDSINFQTGESFTEGSLDKNIRKIENTLRARQINSGTPSDNSITKLSLMLLGPAGLATSALL